MGGRKILPTTLCCSPHLTGTRVPVILAQQNAEAGAAMQTLRIYRLKDLDKRTRARMLAAQREAARVWMDCVARHSAARTERSSWPDRDDLQRETKGGQYALHSQSIQMVCSQFKPPSIWEKFIRRR